MSLIRAKGRALLESVAGGDGKISRRGCSRDVDVDGGEAGDGIDANARQAIDSLAAQVSRKKQL